MNVCDRAMIQRNVRSGLIEDKAHRAPTSTMGREEVCLGSRWLGMALLIGAGALAVTALAAGPPIMRAARPLLRQGVKRGMEVYARLRAGAAEWAEDVEDLIAEARSESGGARATDPNEAQPEA